MTDADCNGNCAETWQNCNGDAGGYKKCCFTEDVCITGGGVAQCQPKDKDLPPKQVDFEQVKCRMPPSPSLVFGRPRLFWLAETVSHEGKVCIHTRPHSLLACP
jgi:hypothetical protein